MIAGSARVTAISDGTLPWDPEYGVSDGEYRAACPGADAEGKLLLGLQAFHIAIGEASIVVDPCDWNEEMRSFFTDYRPAPGLMPGLAALGVDPAQVTHVLVTHAHADHFNGISAGPGGGLRFPNARHLISAAELAAIEPYRSHALFDSSLGEAERRGVLEAFEGDLEAAPGVTMMQAPGESAGHCIVRIVSGGSTAWLLGDLVHHAVEFERPEWLMGPEHRLPEAMLATRRRIYPMLAAGGAVAAFAHETFPPWGKVVREGEAFRWQRLEAG